MNGLCTLFVFLFVTSFSPAALAAWPSFFGPNTIERPDNYSYNICESSRENFGDADSLIIDESRDCIRNSGFIEHSSEIQKLIDFERELSTAVAEKAIIDDFGVYVRNRANENLEKMDEVIACLEKSSRGDRLSLECEAVLERLRSSTINGLPLMREHMAFMHGPEQANYSISIPADAALTEKVTVNISHQYSSTEVLPLSENEQENVSDAYDMMTYEYEQDWMSQRYRDGHPCFVRDHEGREARFASELCRMQLELHRNHSIKDRFELEREEHREEYLNILSLAPHLAYLPFDDSITSNEQYPLLALDTALEEAFKEMREDVKKDLEKLDFENDKAVRSLFRYPSLIESFLAEQNPLEEIHCNIAEHMNTYYGPNGRVDLVQDLGVAFAAIAGGAACMFTAGLGCVVGAAILTETYFLGKSSLRLNQSENLYGAQLINASELEDSRSQRNMSLLFAPLSFVGLHGAQTIVRAGPQARVALNSAGSRSSRIVSRDADILRSQYLNFSPTTASQNRQWIDAARNARASHFFDVENAAIKRLNDTLGDKNLVTSLTNIHKRVLFDKVEQLQRQYPNLNISMYSDFKSSRFAFSGDIPPDLERQLSNIFQEAGEEFEQIIRRSGMSGIPSDESLRHWFNAGFGETADQAGLAARQARDIARSPGASQNLVNYQQVREVLTDNLAGIERQRSSLFDSLSSSPQTRDAIFDSTKSPAVPKVEAFELLRKFGDKGPRQLSEAFQRNLDVQLTPEQADGLIDYARSVDQFSPGLWNEGRVFANLDDAVNGGLSADFKGMGARNLEQVARDLADNSHNLDSAIEAIRRGEGSVTESFNLQKSQFSEMVDTTLHRFNINQTSRCSGDDCVSLVDNPLTQEAREAVVSAIARSGRPNDYRLSFIPPGVASHERSLLASHGELVEKAIRSNLVGSGEGQVSSEILSRVNIAVEMPGQVGSGEVRLMIGRSEGLNLTAQQRQAIENSFERSLEQVNRDLSQELGSGLNYLRSDIHIIP